MARKAGKPENFEELKKEIRENVEKAIQECK